MKSYRNKERLLRSTIIAGVAAGGLIAAPALAQDDEEAAATNSGAEKIVVTGSRIARPDYTANSPVTTIDSEAIELSGSVSIEGLLNELPQVVPGLSSTSNNPGLNGQATVDLRGLGPGRTLVLVNGLRLSPSDKNGTQDLNLIPGALIERVEVVTGGASAVYGSDAAAGVVNFILKKDFEGVEVGGLYGVSDKGDAKEYFLDFTGGGNFDSGKGNATIFASYFNRDQLLQSERDFSQVPLFGPFDGGSSRIPSTTLERSILNPFPNGASRLTIDDAGEELTGFSSYNFAPPNALLLPADRINLAGFFNYDFAPNLEGFSQLLFADSRTGVQLAPSPVAASEGVTISADRARALLTGPNVLAQINGRADPDAPITIQRRMLETGPRVQNFDKKFYQAQFGLRGNVFEDWNWDAAYSFSRTDMYDQLFGDVSQSRFQAALDGCPAGSPDGCIPINPFGVNSITDEQVDYIVLDGVIDRHEYEQQVLQANIAGDLLELPAGPLATAFGVEYRQDDLQFTPSPSSQTDLIGFNGVEPAGGGVSVREVYGEALVPILSGLPGINELTLELGGRLSNYSSAGDVETYKIGGDWEVFEPLRFRAMFNKATIAPSVFQLFRAGDQNFPSYSDPCNSTAGAPVGAQGSDIYNFCAAWLGLDPAAASTLTALSAFRQSDQQVESFIFGNLDLEPEESETITVGAVASPPLPWGDLTLALDYYNIKIENNIGTQSARSVIGACAATLDLTSAACIDETTGGLVAPRLASGQLGGVITRTLNFASETEVTGYDLSVDYAIDVPKLGGTISVSGLVSYLDEYLNNGNDYAGVHNGLGGAFPEWKSNVRTTYSWNDWQFSWQWEYIGEMDDYGYSAAYGYPLVDSINYHDFTVRWFATDRLEASLICENCFDKDPQFPTFSGYVSGPNIDASTYDPIGRYYRVSLRSKF